MYGEDELLISILDGASERALKKIKEEGNITLEDAIPLLLKGQYNHIMHLDKEITEIKKRLDNTATKDDIKNMATKDDIKTIKWVVGVGLGFITVALGILTTFIIIK